MRVKNYNYMSNQIPLFFRETKQKSLHKQSPLTYAIVKAEILLRYLSESKHRDKDDINSFHDFYTFFYHKWRNNSEFFNQYVSSWKRDLSEEEIDGLQMKHIVANGVFTNMEGVGELYKITDIPIE